jgi:hypothetical protein
MVWTLPPIFCGWVVTRVRDLKLPDPATFDVQAYVKEASNGDLVNDIGRPHIVAHMDHDTALKVAADHFGIIKSTDELTLVALRVPEVSKGTVVLRYHKDKVIADEV